jgi:uncharacterized membrane protein
MAKRDVRWPIWKIVLVMIGFVVASVGCFVAAHYVTPRAPAPGSLPPVDPGASARSGMGNMLMLFGALSAGMVLVCGGWLVIRYYQSIPAWKKRARLPAHKRK